MKHIAIIGNGISGITAARHIRKLSDHHITVISSETDHFFSRTALMYIYMGHMNYENTKPYEDWFWEKNRINLRRGHVSTIDFDNQQLHFEDNNTLAYDELILAVGSKPNKVNWPGIDLKGVQGLYHMQDLEQMEALSSTTNHAIVVGGGLIGIEMAEMFHSRHIPVSLLVREKGFWNKVLPPEESAMAVREIKRHGIDLQLETELKAINGDENGRVKSITAADDREIACEFVGITIGVHPNIDFLKDSKLETDKGILVNEYLETNIPGVYAIGDCSQFRNPLPGRAPVEQVWYTGRLQGETLARNLCKKKAPYNPGIWFNSAKLMDIEYQIYGHVQTHPDDNEEQLYWEDNGGRKSIRIAFDKTTKAVRGFNLMGIRYRHEVCDEWIRTNVPIHDVLKQLRAANFDPEFFTTHEQELVDQYNARYPYQPVTLQKKKSLLHKIFG